MIIAKRVLWLLDDGIKTEVPVTIHAPEEDDRAWRCDWGIGWPGQPFAQRALGVDGVQALQLAMYSIGTHLVVSSYHKAGLLIFEEDDPSYGFPAEFPREVGREHTHSAD